MLRNLSTIPGHPWCGAQQRRRPCEPLHVLDDHEARRGRRPDGQDWEQIKKDFGSFADFKKLFNETTAKQFGSGWGWLVFEGGKLKVVTSPNQDNPISQGLFPILGNDVWEHAYYLKYQNKRPDYLAAWWNTVNWDEVNKRFEHAQK